MELQAYFVGISWTSHVFSLVPECSLFSEVDSVVRMTWFHAGDYFFDEQSG